MRKMRIRNRKSQITAFVIIGLIIAGVIIAFFFPQLKKLVVSKTPEIEFKNCLESSIREKLDKILIRGGNLNPELYFTYDNESVEYLCYTQEWYKTCVMQKPLLKQSIENEIRKASSLDANKCLADMENSLRNRGYTLKEKGSKNFIVNFQPDKIILGVDLSMELESNDGKISYPSSVFQTEMNSKIYDLIMIASSIQNFEARYGDSTPEDYMALYPNIKVQKLKQSDGTKIYILTSRNTGEELRFATRSLAWPPGYAV
jgi:hypothetical protein